MGKPTILITARFTVGEDQREEFERAVTEFTARADAEPGTLVFRFFRGAPGQYAVVEEYVDADAMRSHHDASEDLLQRIDDCASEAFMDLHGPVGEGMRKWALRVRNVSLYEDPVPAAG